MCQGLIGALQCGQCEPGLDQAHAFVFGVVELVKQFVDVRDLEVVPRLFDLVLVVNVAVGDAPERPVCPHEIKDTFDALQIHGQALYAIGDFARDGPAFEAAHLLEVRELRDLHAVEPDFPAEAPGAQRR